jgi:hypothetical protein
MTEKEKVTVHDCTLYTKKSKHAFGVNNSVVREYNLRTKSCVTLSLREPSHKMAALSLGLKTIALNHLSLFPGRGIGTNFLPPVIRPSRLSQ